MPNEAFDKKEKTKQNTIPVLGHASWAKEVIQGADHTILEGRRILNVHKAYNIRVGLFVESLISNPSVQSKAKKAGKKKERRTVSVSVNKQKSVRVWVIISN